jgi:hypothetical protein
MMAAAQGPAGGGPAGPAAGHTSPELGRLA